MPDRTFSHIVSLKMSVLLATSLLGLVLAIIAVEELEHQSVDDRRQRRLRMLDLKKDRRQRYVVKLELYVAAKP